jgi:phospholipid/cholesterol/gamma-HCH transport system substrate-binding protein
METRSHLTLVGLFVLAVIIAAFGAVSWLLGGTRTSNREDVTFAFPGSISGLAPGASVMFNGIRVGEVTRFEFRPNDPTEVMVVASIDRRSPVKVDSRVQLGFSGLTGSATIQILGGTREAKSLFDKDIRREMKADASSVQDLMEGAKLVLGKADAALNSINTLVRENSESVGRTVKNAETFSASLAKNSDKIEVFMASVGQAADVLTKVSGKAEGLIDNVDTVVKAVEPGQVKSTIANAAKISGDLAKASGEVDGIVRQIKLAADEVMKLSSSAGLAIGDARKIIAAVEADKVRTTVDSVAEFSKYLSGQTKNVDDILSRAKSASANIDSFTGNLAARNGDVDSIVKDAKAIASRLEEASKRVDGILAKIDGVVGSADSQGLFSQGRSFLESATEAAKSVKEMADTFRGRADDVANGINRLTATGTKEIKDFVADGRRTLNSIDKAVNDLDRDPQRLIFGGSGGKVQDYGPGRR